jgi:hypothetical protein
LFLKNQLIWLVKRQRRNRAKLLLQANHSPTSAVKTRSLWTILKPNLKDARDRHGPDFETSTHGWLAMQLAWTE